MLNTPWQRILFQVFLWMAVHALIVLVIGARGDLGNTWNRQLPLLFFQLGPVMLNVWWFFPKLFHHHRGWYSLCTMATIGLLTIFPLLRPPLPPQGPPHLIGPAFRNGAVIMNFFAVTLAVVVSLFIEVFVESQQREREFLHLAKEKVQTELLFLKSQINPHFLFNALNNIYTLAMMGSEKTPESIGRLSDMLRYVLYDCEKETVPLEKEIQYLEDYLALFQLKKEKKLNIKTDFKDIKDAVAVPPMLLMPFVENALKHSNIEGAGGWIRILIRASTDHLLLRIENSVPARSIAKDKTNGIGLKNVRRRLNLLFTNRYELEVIPRDDQFAVTLNLSFHGKD